MRLPVRFTVIAVLILGVMLTLAGSTASGAPAQTTATPMPTEAPTDEATQAATQEQTDQSQQQDQGQQGQQGQALDWQNIPLCLDVIATPDAAQGTTQDQAAGQGTEATAAATQEQGQQAQAAQATATATLDPMTTPFLGVLVGPVADCGVRVVDVFVGSPAETAQLLVDDVIVAVDNMLLLDQANALFPGMNLGAQTQGSAGQAMATQDAEATAAATQDQGQQTDAQTRLGQFSGFNAAPTAAFFNLIRARMPGDTVTLIVQRNLVNQQITVTLGALPEGFAGTSDAEGQQNQDGQGQSVTATPTPGS